MAKKYEDMNDKQKAAHDKWVARSQNMESGGKAMMGLGCASVIFGVMLIAVMAVVVLIFI